MNSEEIGLISGKIWQYLNKNGETPIPELKLNLKLNYALLYASLGWLAREEKIIFPTKNSVKLK